MDYSDGSHTHNLGSAGGHGGGQDPGDLMVVLLVTNLRVVTRTGRLKVPRSRRLILISWKIYMLLMREI